MFEIEKSFRFSAGHVLCLHDGLCKRPHGHSYQLIVKLRAKELIKTGPKTNMIIDFHDLDRIVRVMIDKYFDHQWLNDTLQSDSTTCEFIAEWIYNHLKPHLPNIYSICVSEGVTSSVTFTE